MNVIGIIFANDTALGDLTIKRTNASIPFGGRYRQVDFNLSNMTIAGIRNIGIISRHNYQSLMNHVADGEEWGLELGEGGLEFLTPYAMSTTDSYRGKLESLHSALDFLEFGVDDSYVVMSDSSVLANIDLKKVIDAHVESGKDITVVATAGVADSKRKLDLALKLNKYGEVADMAVDYAAPADYLASMDIFVLSKKWFVEKIKDYIAHNLYHMDRDLVLGGWQKGEVTVNVFEFKGVTLYNESVADYFKNSLALLDENVMTDLFINNHPIYTKVRDRVPTYYGENCHIENCLVADGGMLEGTAKHSVLFRQVTLAPTAVVEDCIIMNDSVVGDGCELKNVILDKNVTVRPGSKLVGTPENPIVIKRGETV